MSILHRYTSTPYTTVKGHTCTSIEITYEILGQPLHTAPIVVLFHALTGNSDVGSEEKGWWKDAFGYDKCIDFNKYTIISFNIIGNGYFSDTIDNYQDFCARDVAILAHEALKAIQVKHIYAAIGGSLGGGIVWELGAAYPNFMDLLIPVATDWKSTDWVMGISGTQEQILLHSPNALEDARKMAMLFYRTPESMTHKFNRELQHEGLFKVNSWLNHHGKKLQSRFSKEAYLMMNQLLGSINITYQKDKIEVFQALKCKVIQIGIDSDLLFTAAENKATQQLLNQYNVENEYHEIQSIHGHDAFLIEFEQLCHILQPFFNTELVMPNEELVLKN